MNKKINWGLPWVAQWQNANAGDTGSIPDPEDPVCCTATCEPVCEPVTATTEARMCQSP